MGAHELYLLLGLALLLAVVLPEALSRAAISAPVVLLAVGALMGLLPLPPGFDVDPVDHRGGLELLTQFTVLIALMGVGLALDRPLSLRDRGSFRLWSATWKLLGIAMPLTIAAVALLAWGALAIAPATALLLGAVLAPTDPVLASDVQVEGPATGDTEDAEEIDESDEVRFALTSEAGLNDGLAMPFVYAALFVATLGPVREWGVAWLGWELVGKSLIGTVVGYAVGWLLGRFAFRAPSRSLRLAETGEPLLALAAVLLAYGASELVGGYGFLAVFVCAMAIRSAERAHEYHALMHQVVERLERLLTLVVLLLVGIGLARGLLAHLDWRGALVGLALVFAIRPACALLAFTAGRRGVGRSASPHPPVERRERLVTAFFGVRGVGTIYYLAFATGQTHFAEERWLWSTVAFAIVLSVVVHGVLATPAMRWLERARRRSPTQMQR